MEFKLCNPTRLYFGTQSLMYLEQELKDVKNMLLVYGGGSIKKQGIYAEVMQIVSKLNIKHYELTGVPANPTLDKVYEGIDICKNHDIDYILAVGGGSVVDCTKAIAVGAVYDGDIWDVIKYKKPAFAKILFGVVLTNSATSTENNYYSVISNTQSKEKIGWAIWPLNFPTFSIVNPNHTRSVPKDHTIYGVVDIMSHLIEDYFHHKDVEHPIVAITDRHMETMLVYMIDLGLKLVNDLDNLSLREAVSYIGTQALSTQDRHITEGDWAFHAIEHAISAIYDIPHGGGLAIVIPHWMRFVIGHAQHKFKMFAKNVMSLKQMENESDKTFGLRGIEALETFLKQIGAPLKLKDYQIGSEHMNDLVEKAMGGQKTIGKMVPLDSNDVRSILESSL